MKFENYLKESPAIKFNKGIPDSVGKFFVLYGDLEDPEYFEDMQYTIEDILFESDLGSMMLQFRGGLEMNKVAGIFKSRNDALKYFKKEYSEAYDLMGL